MHRFDHALYRVSPGLPAGLETRSTVAPADMSREIARAALEEDTANLRRAQRLLWASDRAALLIILQGLDAAGKDGTIRHVMRGVNPQGCSVHSFKAPSSRELEHHFLWRPMQFLPERGRITIFNRSYYEEVLVVRVHPSFLEKQPPIELAPGEDLWDRRFSEINEFERWLVRNGTRVLKFMLNHSKEEQKRRFLARLDEPHKHWKFSAADLRERRYWDEYRLAYDAMLTATSTESAPWYVIPADDKWFARALVADIVGSAIDELGLRWPEPDAVTRADLAAARRELEAQSEE